MQTELSAAARQRPGVAHAEAVLRKCVHCGFCNATCPTYQLLGDERDGPRGRIYLIKQMLESGHAGEATRQHLDRCLSCRSCETTCPSGVEYHQLLDFGRDTLASWQPRRPAQRVFHRLLRTVLLQPRLFAPLLALGFRLRPWLPTKLAEKIPLRRSPAGSRPAMRHRRKMLLLEGCVQPSLSPATNAATARVFDRFGISIVTAPAAACCGALDFHLDAQEAGRSRARRNIDAWWPAIEAGAEAILVSASGCGAFVKDYGLILAEDPQYAARAAQVSALARDPVEVLRAEPRPDLALAGAAGEQASAADEQRLVFHSPCSLQHGQRLAGAVETLLQSFGFQLAAVEDAHLCCGAAGTYALTQPELSERLRREKLARLTASAPAQILTANVGCQCHLDAVATVPVRHWIEVLDEALARAETSKTNRTAGTS